MGNFRETNWFKRGELVEETLEEKQGELPIEDRYADRGATTCTDSVLYGVHTGETTPIPSMRCSSGHVGPTGSDGRDLQQLVRELKRRNRTIVAMCGAAVVVVAVLAAGIV